MSPLSLLLSLFLLSTLAQLTCGASNVTITSVSGCRGALIGGNATGCTPGTQLTIFGSNFHLLDFATQADVAVGWSTYWTCDGVQAVSPQQLRCTLPYVQMAGSAFMPVFVFNQSTGHEYTSKGVGVQYGARVELSLLGGCGWTSPDGIVYGCNGDSGWNGALSNVTLQIDRLDLLPADWQLAVNSSAYSVQGSQWCSTVAQSTVMCTLPYMPIANRGAVQSIWLQNSNGTALTDRVSGVVYAVIPVIDSVTGCCSVEYGTTYGCGASYPLLTVTGSGFAQAWNGGAPTRSPIYILGTASGSLYQCMVGSFDEWSMVCDYLLPAVRYDDSQELLTLSVLVGDFVYGAWGVQISNSTDACPGSTGSSSSSSTGIPVVTPQITAVGGPNCGGSPVTCSTNSPTLFTVVGSGFAAPSYGDGSPVSLTSEATNLQYTCGVSLLNDTTIVCMTLQPSLFAQDSNVVLTLIVNTVYGASNSWYLFLNDNGPFAPPAPSSASTTIAGMNLLTFIIVVAVASLVAVSVLLVAVLSCCCGVSLSVLACCCRAASASRLSMSAPLLVERPAAAYPVSSASHFGLSLPPNPHNYPAVPGRHGGY